MVRHIFRWFSQKRVLAVSNLIPKAEPTPSTSYTFSFKLMRARGASRNTWAVNIWIQNSTSKPVTAARGRRIIYKYIIYNEKKKWNGSEMVPPKYNLRKYIDVRADFRPWDVHRWKRHVAVVPILTTQLLFRPRDVKKGCRRWSTSNATVLYGKLPTCASSR